MIVLLKNMTVTVLQAEARTPTYSPRHRPHCALLIAIVMMSAIVVFSLSEQLFIDNLPSADLFSGRWPLVLAAASAGAMLALAGTIMQSVTANPLASPEGLRVSAGAALGIVATLLLAGTFSSLAMLLGGIGGALATFIAMMAITAKSAHAPGPALLAGAAIGTIAATLITDVLASGDPRAIYVLAWSMGPTYRATAITGLVGLAILLVALVLLPLFTRSLKILPLGDQAARELGLAPRRSRTSLLSLSAILTAAATLIVGPLSFVGLIAPHIAAMTTPPKPLNRALCAAAAGAALMTAADWLGRSIHFPYEIPAGVLAAFVGGPYFQWLLYRRHP